MEVGFILRSPHAICVYVYIAGVLKSGQFTCPESLNKNQPFE